MVERNTISDGTTIAFTVVPQTYTIGTDVRALLGDKAWTLLTDTLPMNARRMNFYASQDCWVRFQSFELTLGQGLGNYTPVLGGGVPAPHFIPKETVREFVADCAILWIVRDTLDGNLYVSAFA